MTAVTDADGRGGALPDDDTASAHVCRDVPRVAPAATAREVRAALSTRTYESVADVAVCRGDRLVGLVPVEVVLAVSDAHEIGTLMDPRSAGRCAGHRPTRRWPRGRRSSTVRRAWPWSTHPAAS
jgi:hypothetical protein